MSIDEIDQWLLDESCEVLKKCAQVLVENGLSIEDINKTALPMILVPLDAWRECARNRWIEAHDIPEDRILH